MWAKDYSTICFTVLFNNFMQKEHKSERIGEKML